MLLGEAWGAIPNELEKWSKILWGSVNDIDANHYV
jgi:hypothetical protein